MDMLLADLLPRRPSGIYVTVTATAGDAIGDVLRDMRALAERLGITVHTSFNGIPLFVSPGADVWRMEREYMDLCGKPAPERWIGVFG